MKNKYYFVSEISQEEFENRLKRKTAKGSVTSLFLPKTYISRIGKNKLSLTVTGKYGLNGLQPWFCCKYSILNRQLKISGKFTYPCSVKLFFTVLLYVPFFTFIVSAQIDAYLLYGVIYSLLVIVLFRLSLSFSNIFFRKRNKHIVEFFSNILK
jgi:hypothetical protein